MTDIEVLEREMQCVQRKAQINCTNCGSCDLLMDDGRILTAYTNAITALRFRKASYEQVKKALQERGFETLEELLAAYDQVKSSCLEAEKNEPLTLDELREMDGEPVWVVQPDGILPTFWGLVCVKGETVSSSLYCAIFDDYDSEWLAYRRPPEDII